MPCSARRMIASRTAGGLAKSMSATHRGNSSSLPNSFFIWSHLYERVFRLLMRSSKLNAIVDFAPFRFFFSHCNTNEGPMSAKSGNDKESKSGVYGSIFLFHAENKQLLPSRRRCRNVKKGLGRNKSPACREVFSFAKHWTTNMCSVIINVNQRLSREVLAWERTHCGCPANCV